MDSKKFDLAMTALKFVTAIVGAIACFWVWTTSPGSDVTELQKAEYADTAQMSLAIYYTIGIIFAAVAAILIFFVFQLITNTKKTAQSIIGVVAAFVVFLILWMAGTSDTAETVNLKGNPDANQATLNWVSAGIYTIILGIVVAIAATRIGQIRALMNRFKK